MKKRDDDLNFESAWDNQFKEEQEKKTTADKKEAKKHVAPVFRGQRNVIEKRSEIIMKKKQEQVHEKKDAKVVAEISSKEGDDFDVEW